MKQLLFLLALVVPLAQAETGVGKNSASATIQISVTVKPVFNVISQEVVPEGVRMTIWTNMKEINLNGMTFRFNTVGQHVILVPKLVGQDGVIQYNL
jgi:hypothetical protein